MKILGEIMFTLPIALSEHFYTGMNEKAEEIWKNGFVKFPKILSSDEIKILNSHSKEFFDDVRPWNEKANMIQKGDYHMPAFGDENWAVLINLPGRSSEIDKVLEVFFSNKQISEFLELMIGKGWKLWELSIRRATAFDSGLYVHQDAPGELGISILLKEQKGHSGTTSFIKGSHRFAIRASEAKAEFYIRPNILKYFSTPATGCPGDVYVYFKDTWHGRTKSYSSNDSDAIMMSLYPVGYSFTPFIVPPQTMQNLPPKISRMLSIQSNIKNSKGDGQPSKNEKSEERLVDFIRDKRFYTHRYLTLLKHFNKFLMWCRDGKKI